jgi:hypothetical protein
MLLLAPAVRAAVESSRQSVAQQKPEAHQQRQLQEPTHNHQSPVAMLITIFNPNRKKPSAAIVDQH